MGYRHDRDDILAGALETAVAGGLSRLSYGRVAQHLGINDRTVVYYFPTKGDLVGSVLGALGSQLLEVLSAAFTERSDDHVELVRRAWPLLTTPEAAPAFALFFEANGLAAAGQAPYTTVVPALVEGWIEWTAGNVSGPEADRRGTAEAAIAVVDGLLLLRHGAGPDAADRAAQRLGVL